VFDGLIGVDGNRSVERCLGDGRDGQRVAVGVEVVGQDVDIDRRVLERLRGVAAGDGRLVRTVNGDSHGGPLRLKTVRGHRFADRVREAVGALEAEIRRVPDRGLTFELYRTVGGERDIAQPNGVAVRVGVVGGDVDDNERVLVG